MCIDDCVPPWGPYPDQITLTRYEAKYTFTLIQVTTTHTHTHTHTYSPPPGAQLLAGVDDEDVPG